MSLARPLSLAVGVLFLGTSCVSKARYDEALAQVQYYQRAYQDLESYQGKLEGDNDRLQGELGLLAGEGASITEAATASIDQRLEDLRRITDGIGAAPGDVTVLEVEGGYGLRVTDAVLFDSGSTEIKEAGREVLLEVAKQIQARPYERIWVRGHTDSDPVSRPATLERFPHGNLQLSATRAIEVAALLSNAGGLPRDRIIVAGFGPNEPVASNASAEEKRRNRRVEIFVIDDPASAQDGE